MFKNKLNFQLLLRTEITAVSERPFKRQRPQTVPLGLPQDWSGGGESLDYLPHPTPLAFLHLT